MRNLKRIVIPKDYKYSLGIDVSEKMNAQDLRNLSEAYTQLSAKKDDSYLETDVKKRQKNNEKARKDMEKMGTSMKNPHFEEVRGQDTEMRKAASADRKAGDKKLPPSEGKANADKMQRSIKFYDKLTKKEELELDENRRAARAAGGYKDDSKKQNDPSKAGFTGVGNMSIDQIRKMSARMDKEKKESYDPMDDPDFDHDEAEKNRGVSGKNNPKGGKALSKKKKMKEGLDPVGKEDGDVNNDGKKDKSDKYLMNRRKAIGKALASTKKVKEEKEVDEYIETVAKVKELERKNDVQRWVRKENFSNWRTDLIEVIDEVDADKPIKEKKVRNKITINPKLGEAVEEIGGEILEIIEVDEAVYGGSEAAEKSKKLAAAKKGLVPGKGVQGKYDQHGREYDTKTGKLKEACWSSHKQVGMKKKGGKMVPNCVPKNEEVESVGEAVYGGTPEKKKDSRMTVTAADKKANTPAYQKMKAGDKRYKAADHMGEDVEVDEAMMAGPRKDAMKKKEYGAKSGSDRATAFNIGTRRDVSVSDPKIKSRGGRTDKRTGEGDRGMGNAAKRRMKEDASMSNQEVMLQKRKARLDRMIAMKRQQELGKAKKSEAPGRAMGEDVEVSEAKVEEGKSDRPLGMMHSFSRGVKQKRGEKREVKYGMDSEGNRAGKYKVKKEEVEASCDHSVKGKECPVHGKKDCSSMDEATEDSLRDRRMERGGVDGNNRYKSATKNVAMGGGKKKPYDGMSALEKVKASIRAKHGQGAIKEDAKMAKQSDEKLAALHKKVSGSDQSLPSNQFMMKRVTKEMNRRKKTT